MMGRMINEHGVGQDNNGGDDGKKQQAHSVREDDDRGGPDNDGDKQHLHGNLYDNNVQSTINQVNVFFSLS